MSEDRVVALEIALKTVMAIARNHGLDIDQLCRQSIGAIIGDSAMTWVKADHAGMPSSGLKSPRLTLRACRCFRRDS
ncbi:MULTISPECIES: hypothetical protein [Pseudomonas]|jgi:hypothetical protein|uniref:hypothetical protein n=1 Tax=Pseudomonas TaxID=286 RepID=UPI001110D981|nr:MULTISPECIES: hypothetical protein [Pseudomonas]QCY11549.1 hypothetical protein ELQ88_12445 [Pseudomonas sp. MPC6]